MFLNAVQHIDKISNSKELSTAAAAPVESAAKKTRTTARKGITIVAGIQTMIQMEDLPQRRPAVLGHPDNGSCTLSPDSVITMKLETIPSFSKMDV